MAVHLPVAYEGDYYALRTVCTPEIAGKNYRDYLKGIVERRDNLKALGVDVMLVRLNMHQFVSKANRQRRATWTDLMAYARAVHDEARLPAVH